MLTHCNNIPFFGVTRYQHCRTPRIYITTYECIVNSSNKLFSITVQNSLIIKIILARLKESTEDHHETCYIHAASLVTSLGKSQCNTFCSVKSHSKVLY